MTLRTTRAIALASALTSTMTAHAQSRDKADRLKWLPSEISVQSGAVGAQGVATAVITLVGDPVAVVRAHAASRQMSESQRASVEQSLRAQQQALLPAVAASGASVVGTFQHAIVLGCSGFTDAIVDGIDWAVKNDMDVINISLVVGFARRTTYAEAAQHAAEAGIVVVSIPGNAGPIPTFRECPVPATRS